MSLLPTVASYGLSFFPRDPFRGGAAPCRERRVGQDHAARSTHYSYVGILGLCHCCARPHLSEIVH